MRFLSFEQQKKLESAKRIERLRKAKKYRDDGKEYFKLMEKNWHIKNPKGAGTNNPKFTERALKANAAKLKNI